MAIVATIRRRFRRLVAELVQLRNDARVKVRDMALGAVIGGYFRGNAMGDQLEGLVVGPGVGARLSDVAQTGNRRLVEASRHELLHDIEVGLTGAAVDRVLGRMHLEWIEFTIGHSAKRI